MKKVTVLICICFLVLFLAGEDAADAADAGRYEAYATINYYLDSYEFEKAENLIDFYMGKYPEDPFILTEKAFVLKNIKNKHREALTLLQKALAIYPEYYYSNYLCAHLMFMYRASGKSLGINKEGPLDDDVLKHLDISIKSNNKYYDSVLLKGIVLSDNGNFEKSNEFLEKAAQLKRSPEPYFYTAENHTKLGNADKAMRAYEKILVYSPYNPRALSALSQHYLKQGDPSTASLYLEKLFLKFPNDKKAASKYLYALFAAKEVDKFLEVSDTVDISHSPFLTFARAFFLGQKKRRGEAITLLEPVKNKDLRTNLLLADLYKEQKDYYLAYQTLAGIEPAKKNYLFYSLHMEVLSLLSMNQRIIEVFDAVKNDTAITAEFSPMDYYNIIFAYANLNREKPLQELMAFIKTNSKEKSEPLEDLSGVLEAYRLAPGTHIDAEKIKFDLNSYLIITLFKKQKKYDDAVRLIKEMIKKEKDAGKYMELCEMYRLQEKKTEAAAILNKMDKLYPSSDEVKNFHAYFLAKEKRNLDHALKLSESALAGNTENAAFLDTYGYILLQMGRVDEALPYLEKAYGKSPFEEEIIEHLVDCYRSREKTSKIVEIYQRAINNGVDFKDKLVEKLKQLK